MTGAQLAATPRPLYIVPRTPETLSFKGTEEESQAKGWNNENSCEYKKRHTERKRLINTSVWYVSRESEPTRLKNSEYPSIEHRWRQLTAFRWFSLLAWMRQRSRDTRVSKRPKSLTTGTRQFRLQIAFLFLRGQPSSPQVSILQPLLASCLLIFVIVSTWMLVTKG